MRLNLGCGGKHLEGYTNVDFETNHSGKQPDVSCDLRSLPFEADSADEILSVHVIEHFWRWEVEDVLKEWLRVLKPGGKLALECPNLLQACKEYIENPDLLGHETACMKSLWPLYGDPKYKDPLMIHRWGYTPRTLGTLMHLCGFKNIKQMPAQFKQKDPRDMRLVGWKDC